MEISSRLRNHSMHAGAYGASSQVTKTSICRVAQNNSVTAKGQQWEATGVTMA